MKKYFTMIMVCPMLLLMILGLGACSNRSEPSEIPPTVVESTEDSSATISETTPDLVLEATASSENLTQEENPVAVVAEAENYCIDCHTNQETLIDTAKPEQEVVSENEGEG